MLKRRFYALSITVLLLALSMNTFSVYGAVKQSPQVNCDTQAQIPPVECNALVALYNSTGGAYWTNRTNWLNDTPCTWYGVTCAEGRVISLVLSSNNLSGGLPLQLQFLSALQTLNLRTNLISGGLQVWIGDLVNLQTLDLGDNLLSGGLPSNLGNLAKLTSLYLDDNQFEGGIPGTLANLVDLTILHLSRNRLAGPIPTLLGSLTNLVELGLDANQFTGAPSSALGNLSNLLILRLQNNALVGEIPTQLANLTALTELDLGYNMLTASDPDLLAYLSTKDPEWNQTQTIPPGNLNVVPYERYLLLVWQPINYTEHGGFYQICYSITPGGTCRIMGSTASKYTNNYPAMGLPPSTLVYLRVRTYTPAHGFQQNNLWSVWSGSVTGEVNKFYMYSLRILK